MASNIKKSLLDAVNEVLIFIKGDPVNSIDDTDQASDIAQMIQSVYFDMITSRRIPEVKEMIQLDALGDSTRPTYLAIPDNIKFVERLDYDVSTTSGTVDFRTLEWLDPETFLDRMMLKNTSDTTTQTMSSINSSAVFIINNDKMPKYFTSFDDQYIVCDSFDSDEENTLQQSKTRAWAVKIPTFTLSDTFVPDIDEPHYRVMINESRALASAIDNRAINPKLEQHARKQRMLTQNDRDRIGNHNKRANFGRS